jgi:hypothetical protein
VAGLSDIDWVCLARELQGADGCRWLEGFGARYKRWKRLFPFLGEPLVMEECDLRYYLRWGGVRAREFRHETCLLEGAGAQMEGVLERPLTAQDNFNECTHAYTLLMQWALMETAAPAASVRHHIRKAVLDILRYGDAISAEGGRTARPRRDMPGILAAAPQFWPGLLRNLDQAAAWRDLLPEICAEALRSLHRAAAGVGAPARSDGPGLRWIAPDAGAGAVAPAGSLQMLRLDKVRARLGQPLVGVCWDDIYRSYFVWDDAGLEAPDLKSAFQSLSRMHADGDIPGTLPMLLSRNLWRRWQQSPYLESPNGLLDTAPAAADQGLITRAGRAFPGCSRFQWGLESSVQSSDYDHAMWAAGRQSLANLRFCWRFGRLGFSGLSPTYIRHYGYSRVMGLRLLLDRGIAAPFFDFDHILGLYRQEFPETAQELERMETVAPDRAGAGEDMVWLDAQLRLISDPGGE